MVLTEFEEKRVWYGKKNHDKIELSK